jgi:hypothetical protein
MESPGERYNLPMFGFYSPSEVKSELDIFSGELKSSSPVESPKMLLLCNFPKAAEAVTEVTSNHLESWI